MRDLGLSRWSKTQLAAYGAAALLVLLAGFRMLQGWGGEDSLEPARVVVDGGAPTGAANGPAATEGGRSLFVHVAGAVRRPGLYRVAPGSRLAAAVHRAGGPTRRAELAGVNLAAQLSDGQQVVVPRRGAGGVGAAAASGAGGTSPPAGTGSAGMAAGGTTGAQVSLASATLEQLDALDGIGPTLGARILEYRDSHGGFRSIDELRQVEGIGEKRFETLREAVRP